MRILHVLGKLDRGGAETSLVRTLRHIDRHKYQFDFLVHSDKPGVYDEEVKALGARVIPCLSPSHPFRYARNFFRVLRDYGPYDCVHSHVHHFSGYVLALARIAGVPKRIAHSRSDRTAAESKRGVARTLYLSAMKRLLRLSATGGLAVSGKAANSLFGENWPSDSRWQVLYSGIDLEQFAREVDRSKVRAEVQIPEDAFVIGHVGRLVPEKNHSFLLAVMKLVFAHKPNALCVMVGDGPLRQELQRKATQLGISDRLRFLGSRDDVPRLMKGAMDVFVLPSVYEGFPVVLMEAQAAGLPCVISDSITSEADIVQELITRVSLTSPLDVWSAAIEDCGKVSTTVCKDSRISEYSIDSAVQRLCHAYDN